MRSAKRVSKPGSLRGALLPLVVALLASTPASADPAMAWIQKMSDAMRNLSYRGNFVYMHENQLESMEIEHYRDEQGEKERLLSLNGEAREVIRDDQSLTCIWPSSREVVVDQSRSNSYSPIFIPDDIARLERFYSMKLLGMDRIAGQETMVVHIEPRDQYRYGIMFWINRENGLMMKSSLIGEDKREIEQVMFTRLELLADDSEFSFRGLPRIDEGYSFVQYHRGGEAKNFEVDESWQIDSLPGGFWQDSVLRREVPENGQRIQQMVFTDGLASLSVFIERYHDETMAGGMSMGAVNAFIRILNDYSITAIGEVPAVTVRRVAESVRYRGE
jgi:sigma-E factor negative regulatory protein RseB